MPRTPLKIKIILILTALFLGWFWLAVPATLFDHPTSNVIEDRNGILLNASIASDGQWRFPEEEVVPDKFIKCITTFEDRRFFLHPGVDAVAISRAMIKNIRSKKTVQGGSTLTMQVVRLSRPQTSRNIWNKLLESFMALRLETNYSKEQILKLYASNAPFGGNVIGLEAAAWRYYGRGAEMLSWGEMAALAVLPNAPSLVHPGRNRMTLEKKRNRLLDDLLKRKLIDTSTCELAKMEPLPGNPLPLPQWAPHLLQRFKNDIPSKSSLPTRTRTTIDERIQRTVIEILNNHHGGLKANGINNACALILDVTTGDALAYVGNIYKPENPDLESAVDVIKAPRSPGSTLKPILYAAALTEGMILPHSLMPDVPTQIGGYTPQNYDRQFDGAVNASMALSRSLNIPAVKLLQQYKYARFYDLLKQLGMRTLNRPADNYGLSLILGGSEVTMWDLAGIYAGMARTLNHQVENKGMALKRDFHAPNYVFSEQRVKETPASTERINSLDATSTWFTFQAMEEVMRPGEEGLWQQFTSSQRIAWKTGTSFGFRDAWAIGITPKYVVAVWVGNTDGEGRAGLIGVQTAAPIMFDIFKTLPASKWFSSPQNNFSFVPVCKQSGFRANIDCADADTIMVSQNGFKAPLCPYHQIIHLDRSAQFRVNESCETPANMVHKSWFVLPPTMEWYYKQKNHDYKLLPPFAPGCEVNTLRQMEIIYPSLNAKIYVPLEINGERGKTVFTATHRKTGSKIFWHLDREYIGETTNYHQMALSPSDGLHTLTIVDEQGESISRNFEILGVKHKR